MINWCLCTLACAQSIGGRWEELVRTRDVPIFGRRWKVARTRGFRQAQSDMTQRSRRLIGVGRRA